MYCTGVSKKIIKSDQFLKGFVLNIIIHFFYSMYLIYAFPLKFSLRFVKHWCILQVTVLDGKTGEPLVRPFFRSSSMANTSPLTVSMEGLGNDLFIYWVSDCMGHEGEGGKFEFVEGTNVHEQSRADTCRLRYNTKSFSKLCAMNKNLGFPGQEIYYSGESIKIWTSFFPQ